MTRSAPLAYPICLVAMIFIGRFELRTDDAGIVVLFVLVMTAFLGCLHPRHAWAWAFAGLCVPLAHVVTSAWGNVSPGATGVRGFLLLSAFMLVVGLIGSVSGAAARKFALA